MKSRSDFRTGEIGDIEYKQYLLVCFTGLNVAARLSARSSSVSESSIDLSIRFAIKTIDQLYKTPMG